VTSQERYVNDLMAIAQELLHDGASVGDLKIATGALREMREAFKVFAAYRGARKVSAFGSARTREGDPVFKLAEECPHAHGPPGALGLSTHEAGHHQGEDAVKDVDTDLLIGPVEHRAERDHAAILHLAEVRFGL